MLSADENLNGIDRHKWNPFSYTCTCIFISASTSFHVAKVIQRASRKARKHNARQSVLIWLIIGTDDLVEIYNHTPTG